jgi:hypothetical protein
LGLYLFTTIILLLLVSLIVFRADARRKPAKDNLYRTRALLSDAEKVLFRRLKEALPEHEIFPKVALDRFIDAGVQGRATLAAAGRDPIDFLVMTGDMIILAAIELDTGASDAHGRKRPEREAVLQSAGIAHWRYPVNRMPSTDVIRQQIPSTRLSSAAEAPH